MSKKKLFACYCPSCNRKLFRRKIRRNQPTTCGNCGFVIKNPYDVFIPKSKYLKQKNNYKNNKNLE